MQLFYLYLALTANIVEVIHQVFSSIFYRASCVVSYQIPYPVPVF